MHPDDRDLLIDMIQKRLRNNELLKRQHGQWPGVHGGILSSEIIRKCKVEEEQCRRLLAEYERGG